MVVLQSLNSTSSENSLRVMLMYDYLLGQYDLLTVIYFSHSYKHFIYSKDFCLSVYFAFSHFEVHDNKGNKK